MGRLLAAVFVTATTGVSSALAHASIQPLPRLLSAEFGAFAVRPQQIVLSGDGSNFIAGEAAWIGPHPDLPHPESQFGHIVWTAWTASRATGNGVQWSDNCKPNCAQGTYFPAPEHLIASLPRAGAYTRLVITVIGGTTTRLILKHANPGPTGYVWN